MSFGLIAAVFIYLAIIAWLGYRGYGKTKTAGDYLLAGRNAHPYVMALSYGATFISTSAIVGFGGTASLMGMSLLWLAFLNIFLGIFIAFVFFGKRTRRIGLNLDAHTFPELLGRRMNSRFIQVFTGFMIFIFMPLYAAAVLIGASRIIEVLLNVPFEVSVVVFSILVGAYVILGGLKSVMYTDALQGTLMFLGMITLLLVTYIKLGGVVEAHRSLASLSAFIPESMTKGGISCWTKGPAGGSPMWWTIYSSLVLGVGVGALAQPQLAVRFMTVRSDKELNRSVAVGGVFILVCVASVYVIGPLTNVFFHGTIGKIAIAAAEGNVDRVIPLYLDAAMPSWFSIVFILVILSAAMSTLSSQYHAIGTSVSRGHHRTGIYERPGNEKRNRRNHYPDRCFSVSSSYRPLGHGDGRRRDCPGHGDFLRTDGLVLSGTLHGRSVLEALYAGGRDCRDYFRIYGFDILFSFHAREGSGGVRFVRGSVRQNNPVRRYLAGD